MGKAVVMEKVRQSLDGLEIRQKMRDAARRLGSQVRLIHIARRRGMLDDLDIACDWLTALGMHWSDEQWYSVTILYAAGVTLAYGPDKKLQWQSAPKIAEDGLPEQWKLFSDESSDGPSSASSESGGLPPEPR